MRGRLVRKYFDPWTKTCGFDFRRLQGAVLCNDLSPYVVETFGAGDRALSAPALVARFDLPEDRVSPFNRVLVLRIEQDGLLDGFLGTFDAMLSPSVIISTGIDQPETHWKQVVFPVLPARPVRQGERIRVGIGFLPDGGWTCQIDR